MPAVTQHRYKTVSLLSLADAVAVAQAVGSVIRLALALWALAAVTLTRILLCVPPKMAMTACVVIVALSYGRCTSPTCGHTVYAAPLLLALLTGGPYIFESVCARGRAAIRRSSQLLSLGWRLLTVSFGRTGDGSREASETDLLHLTTFALSSTQPASVKSS